MSYFTEKAEKKLKTDQGCPILSFGAYLHTPPRTKTVKVDLFEKVS